MSVGDEVKALTFDVFGTVVDWRGSVAAEAKALLGGKGLDLDWNAFALSWRAKYKPSMARVRNGERPFVKLDILHRENLEEVLKEFRVTGLSEAEKEHLNRSWHRLSPWPDVVAGLARMKRKYIIATLSNGNIAMMVNIAKKAGLPWDAILGAEVTRAYKPQPEAYLLTCAALDLEPRQVMLVAAHNKDLVAAAETGMRTGFVLRRTEYGENETRDQRAEHDFDVTADTFTGLAGNLGCPD